MYDDDDGAFSFDLYHKLLIASISEGLDEWIATAHTGQMKTVYTHPGRPFGFYPFIAPMELQKWSIGRDEDFQPIYLYSDGTVSMVADRRQWGVLGGRTVARRKRYPLIPDKIPMTPRVHRTLRQIGAAIAAPLPQHFLQSL